MILRKLWSWERERLRAHLLRLDPEDRRLRFGRAVTDDVVHRYCDLAEPGKPATGKSIVVGAFVEGTLRGVAELVTIPGGIPAGAEVALSVERPWQGQGVGERLLQKALLLARNRFVDTVYMLSLRENAPMVRLAQKFGAATETYDSTHEGRIRLPWPSAFSLYDELREEGEAMVGAVLELPVEDFGRAAAH